VQRIRRFLALLLLAAWLPATLHCGFEAAGLAVGSDCCADVTHAADTNGCNADNCDILEGGFTPSNSLHATAPAVFVCACLIPVQLPPTAITIFPPPVTGVNEAAAPPLELIQTWVFASRAALSPRAPGIAS
jgi:hypothetical protein